jgi:hypothetical protein
MSALETLPLPLVSGNPKFLEAVDLFTRKADGLGLCAAEGIKLLDALNAWREQWKSQPNRNKGDVHSPILDAAMRRKEIDPELLRQMAMTGCTIAAIFGLCTFGSWPLYSKN